MKFKSVDKLNEFSFHDSVIRSFVYTNDIITMELDGVIVRGENENNARMEDMYCDTITLRLKDAKIIGLVEEGYKYYDGNDKLVEEVPDRAVSKEEQAEIMSNLINAYIFQLLVKERQNEKCTCELGVDIGEEDTKTFWFTFAFSKSVLEWNRYCNPVKLA